MNRYQQVESVSRCALFVDVQSMFYAAKHLHNSKIDYANLLKGLSVNRDIVNATAYLAYKQEVDTKGFEEALRKSGYDIKRKTDERVGQGDKERTKAASWELGMSIDMIKWAQKVDTIILVSGNGAFVETFIYLKSQAVRLEVASFNPVTSSALKNLADDFIDISSDVHENCLRPLTLTSDKYVGLPKDEEESAVLK